MDKPGATGTQPIQRVFRGRGTLVERFLSCAEPDAPAAPVRTIADEVLVTEIMAREVICARRDLEAECVVDLIARNRIGCVPVVEEPGRPIGMITKLDLVEQLLSDRRGEAPLTANDLMMPLAITLGANATVAHVAALMAAEDVHHIPIVDDDGRLVGIISTMDVVRWLAKNDGFARRAR